MNEIEKLYKNAEIPKYGKRQCKDSEYLECQNYCFCNMDNKCDKFIFEYPPFTAEKQLELIKKLGNINIDIDNGCYMSSEILKVEAHCDTFEETLAEFINNLWQSLTKEEKQQIKEILK